MRGAFSGILLVPQALLIILYSQFVDYGEFSGATESNPNSTSEDNFDALYPMFQDVHVMIFIGFGFLMTFLKRYGFGSVGFNLLLSALVIQWAILMRGCLDLETIRETGKVSIDLESILNADFAAGAVLISFGAVLGVLSPIQLILMAILEVVFYSINEFVIINTFQIADIGGSLVIHAFGAYFGLAVSAVHWRPDFKAGVAKEASVYHSDIFAMIGTLFLWLFWPSFNGAPAAGSPIAHRAVITTLLSLAASGVAAFAMSSVVDKSGKLSMVHVQNATLAGGVAAGSVASLNPGPIGSIIVGTAAGILSVVGYTYITPVLMRSFRLHDTCGVHNLHGMPGVLSAFVAVILARLTTPNTYDADQLGSIYPKVADSEYSFQQQANFQLAGLAVTLAISIGGGVITGFLLKMPLIESLKTEDLFEDNNYWQLEDEPSAASEKNGSPLMVMEDHNDDVTENDDEVKVRPSTSSEEEAPARQEIEETTQIAETAA